MKLRRRLALPLPALLLLWSALQLALLSCGPVKGDPGSHRRDGGASDGSAFPGPDLPPGVGREAGSPVDPPPPPPPDNCHEQSFVAQKAGDPDILILMDMSTSMNDQNKYKQTSAAVTNTVTNLEAQQAPIHWGLVFFPADKSCGVGSAPDVPIGPARGSAITSAVQKAQPDGSTPAHKAVELAASYYAGVSDGRAHYILIATDGAPNCDRNRDQYLPCLENKDCPSGQFCADFGQSGIYCSTIDGSCKATEAIARARAAGIRTYVVGMDIEGDAIPALNRMAIEGGTARGGSTRYYPVADQGSLEAALGNITSETISCTFALDRLPYGVDYVYVTIDGRPVSYDPAHIEGWDLDTQTKTLTFYGSACAELQQHRGTVGVIYRCPPPD